MAPIVTPFAVASDGSLYGASLSFAKSFGGAVSDAGHAIAVDAVGNAYVAGEFAATANFGGGPAGNIYYGGLFFGAITVGPSSFTSVGSSDIFLAKLVPK